ncbi:MAG: tRNA pseudouridine(38-40) synthase TruA [Alphaproteobacteria bacterium]
MRRIKLKIEYDGTSLVGWQAQNNGVSVQSLVEDAIKGFSGETVSLFGAGRTDAGVHALGQVAHFDLAKENIAAEKIKYAINAHLKNKPVVILESEETNSDFHARFSAKWRKYRYIISNRSVPLVINENRAWWVPQWLDESKIFEASQFLVGKHDFSSFRAAECQAKSPIKTLDYITVERESENIIIEVKARSFLHHMVRNIVGTLKLVGQEKLSPEDVNLILEARDRKRAGATAPASGLYFLEVGY